MVGVVIRNKEMQDAEKRLATLSINLEDVTWFNVENMDSTLGEVDFIYTYSRYTNRLPSGYEIILFDSEDVETEEKKETVQKVRRGRKPKQ